VALESGVSEPAFAGDGKTAPTPSTSPRILVVEDEPKVADALRAGLQTAGYEPLLATSGEQGFFRAHAEKVELIVLDLMLPDRDGLEVLEALRRDGFGVPVLILTAKDAVSDRVAGLDKGADDYLVKPFAFPELLARVRALLRRGRPDPPPRLALADLELDAGTHAVTRAGRALELTAREFELIEYLLRHQGRLVSRGMLARDVWKQPARGSTLDNVIDVHIARLRKKVDHGSAVRLIHTVRGVGFVARVGEP
jgi:DNA-binding response OmpR family regulator